MMAATMTKPLRSLYRSVLSDLLLFLESEFDKAIFKELLKELLDNIFYLLSVRSCLRLF
jgi:hypothetical protein